MKCPWLVMRSDGETPECGEDVAYQIAHPIGQVQYACERHIGFAHRCGYPVSRYFEPITYDPSDGSAKGVRG